MKGIVASLIGIAVIGLSGSVLADDATTTPWKGELYNIMPNRDGVTEDYCKTHVLDAYKVSANMVEKEVTADNGVMAKNINHKSKKMGEVYSISGEAMFTGTTDGKEWKEKVHFNGYTLAKDTMEQGVWYTKSCKGFYKVGPA